MDFFASQDAARHHTSRLVLYYIAAISAIVATVYVAFMAVVYLPAQKYIGMDPNAPVFLHEPFHWWDAPLFAMVGGATLALILAGTLYKIAQLRRGGVAVAESLGGRLINPLAVDLDERRVLNVVEEMAIASGTPVPPVYLLERSMGINAFAAGFSPADAVIGVTRGCLEELTRDELQGVIAHEFSHVLNGDMRLNIRLIGLIHGLVLIAVTGSTLLEVLSRTASRRAYYTSRGPRGNPAILFAIVGFGLALLVIGSIGEVLGQCIQSAVSRQREFLADASAVQFTRNPKGIAGALKRIGGWRSGGRVSGARAREISHMLFSGSRGGVMARLFATHPPLVDRILRIDPEWDGEWETVPRPLEEPTAAAPVAVPGVSGLSAGRAAEDDRLAAHPDTVVARVGAPTQEHLDYARKLILRLRPEVREAVQDPFSARALVYALLLNEEKPIYDRQVALLKAQPDGFVWQEAVGLVPAVREGGAGMRLPLADLAVPALRHLSSTQYEEFRGTVQKLIHADERVSLFEYALGHLIQRHLAPTFTAPETPTVRYHALAPILPQTAELLGALATLGHDTAARAEEAYRAAVATLKEAMAPPYTDVCERPRAQISEALRVLRQAAPGVRKRVLHACVACVHSDEHVTLAEAELLRAVADALDCPLPPFLPSEIA